MSKLLSPSTFAVAGLVSAVLGDQISFCASITAMASTMALLAFTVDWDRPVLAQSPKPVVRHRR